MTRSIRTKEYAYFVERLRKAREEERLTQVKVAMNLILKNLKSILWASPLIKLIVDSIDAISDGYGEIYIKDPGHKIIKWLDAFVILVTWFTLIVIFFPSLLYYSNVHSNEYLVFLLTLFFPYFFNFKITALLYVISIFLFIYNKNRKNIIRKINEVKGVW